MRLFSSLFNRDNEDSVWSPQTIRFENALTKVKVLQRNNYETTNR